MAGSNEENEECRICRAKGTATNPLFSPCLCSGSIKFVHQGCLMDWLKHSRKNDCALCKTSFRITKVYAQGTPQTPPLHVFAYYLIPIALRRWFRTLLTMSIWICLVPYLTRCVWFWIGDREPRFSFYGYFTWLAFSMRRPPTCPINPLTRENKTTVEDVKLALSFIRQHDFPAFFVELLLGSISTPAVIKSSSDSLVAWHSLAGAFVGVDDAANTLLSYPRFLRNMICNATMNRTLVFIFEGQIIAGFAIFLHILQETVLYFGPAANQQPLDFNELRGPFAQAAIVKAVVVSIGLRGRPIEEIELFEAAMIAIGLRGRAEQVGLLEAAMELIGMRGPIAGLFRKACSFIFLAVLPLCLYVFFPYYLGHLVLWAANPTKIFRSVIGMCQHMEDLAFLFDLLSRMASYIMYSALTFARIYMPTVVIQSPRHVWSGGGLRIPHGQNTLDTINTEHTRYPVFHSLKGVAEQTIEACAWLTRQLLAPKLWPTEPVTTTKPPMRNPELTCLSVVDRLWVASAGCVTLFIVFAICVSCAANGGRIDVARRQFGGVAKFVLVSIVRRLCLPLYCGGLLGIALLPLFSTANFATSYPLTSALVYWVAGSIYLVHFQHVVSLCHRITQQDLIRQPSDTRINPITEILQKTLTIHLREMLYSGFINIGLVLICLGGIVYGSSLTFHATLTIYSSPNVPMVRFLADLFISLLISFAEKLFTSIDVTKIKCIRPFRTMLTLYAYSAAAVYANCMKCILSATDVVESLTSEIRDAAYATGEQLHNIDEPQTEELSA